MIVVALVCARTLSGITMQGESFRIALSGDVSFLEVLKFNASFMLDVGYEGVGSWRVAFSAQMDFFGLVTLSAAGSFNYKGYFDISLDGELVLGSRSFGLVANFHFRVAFGERDVVGQPGLTEFFFLVEFSGGASLRAFGITFAGVNIAASVTAIRTRATMAQLLPSARGRGLRVIPGAGVHVSYHESAGAVPR